LGRCPKARKLFEKSLSKNFQTWACATLEQKLSKGVLYEHIKDSRGRLSLQCLMVHPARHYVPQNILNKKESGRDEGSDHFLP
jgi:hypothetical protein